MAKTYYDITWKVPVYNNDETEIVGYADVEVCIEDIDIALALIKALAEPYNMVSITYRFE